MKIVDLRVITLENLSATFIRVDTDEGIHGYGEAHWGAKGPLPKGFILALKPFIVGEDPTNPQQVMNKIWHMGSGAHLGVAVCAVSMAVWDIAGKAAGLPVHRLLGGKIRDRVRIYADSGSGIPLDPEDPLSRYTPEAYAEKARQRLAQAAGYTVLKFDIGFHGPHLWNVTGGVYSEDRTYPYEGHATERGLKAELAIVEALKGVLGKNVGLALDCGPGQSLQASMSLAKALEPYNLMWVEDLLQGADIPWVDPEGYRLLSKSTLTPIMTGEQVYLRQGFRDLICKNCVDVVAPDIQDVGGLAEAKWVGELADLYGILIAPHNAQYGISFMANVHLGAVLPRNFLCFEFHAADSPWWEDMLVGVDKPLIRDGFATVPETPGLGFELDEKIVREHLAPGETYFDEPA